MNVIVVDNSSNIWHIKTRAVHVLTIGNCTLRLRMQLEKVYY
jgi:hypothetical protein